MRVILNAVFYFLQFKKNAEIGLKLHYKGCHKNYKSTINFTAMPYILLELWLLTNLTLYQIVEIYQCTTQFIIYFYLSINKTRQILVQPNLQGFVFLPQAPPWPRECCVQVSRSRFFDHRTYHGKDFYKPVQSSFNNFYCLLNFITLMGIYWMLWDNFTRNNLCWVGLTMTKLNLNLWIKLGISSSNSRTDF